MICKILGNKLTFWLLKGEQFPAVWVFLDRFHRQTETIENLRALLYLNVWKKKNHFVFFFSYSYWLYLSMILSVWAFMCCHLMYFFFLIHIYPGDLKSYIIHLCCASVTYSEWEVCYFTASSVPVERSSAAFRILSHVHPLLWCHLAKHHS